MSILFFRSPRRDYPSSLEAYLTRKKLLDQIDGINCTVVENIDPLPKTSFLNRSRKKSRTVLVRTEPCVVAPDSYKTIRLRSFDLVVSMGTVDCQNGRVTYWPQLFEHRLLSAATTWSNRINRAVMVASDKISFVPGELYSLRRTAVYGLPNLDLFGYKWSKEWHKKTLVMLKEVALALRAGGPMSFQSARFFLRQPLNYCGQAESARFTYGSYKYCAVIENSATYVSEKLFDALFAGCIPIYVGPDLKPFGLPPGLVIEVEPNLSALSKGLEIAATIDVNEWDKVRLEFLQDPETELKWKSENVYQEVFNRIQNTFQS